MKRLKLLMVSLLLGTAAHGQVMQQFQAGLKLNIPCLSFYPVDRFVNMNGTTPGTQATGTNLGAGTEPSGITWDSAGTGITFAASQIAMPAGVSINGGATHFCGFGTQAFALNSADAFTTANLSFFNGKTIAVYSGWATLPPSNGSSSLFYDLIVAGGASVPYSFTMQVMSGTGGTCGAYGFEIEVSGGATAHSACNTSVTPSSTVYYSFLVNWGNTGTCNGASAPCAALNVYSTSGTTFTQIGSTIAYSRPVSSETDSMGTTYYGNNEAASSVGTIYQQNMMVDFTNHVWPNLPH